LTYKTARTVSRLSVRVARSCSVEDVVASMCCETA